MSLRVAVYMPSLDGGGAERAMVDVARGLAERGLSVDVVLVEAKGPYLDLLPAGVRLVDLGSRRALTSLLPLLRYLRRERPDVLVSTFHHTNVIALTAKRFFARRLAVVARRANNFTMEYANRGVRDRVAMRLERRLLPYASAVVVNSRGSADDLRRSAPRVSRLAQVIYNPVVWPDHAEKAREPVGHPWFGDTGPPVILSAGRLVAAKGHATLLRAFAEVVKSHPARLVVLGEGPERRSLTSLARSLGIGQAVDFPGFHVNPFAYMARARVFVLASTYEGFPNVLVQAMACGTPVVSTDCPSGPSEILEGGKWGRLVPVKDSHSLAGAMVETMDSPTEPGPLISRANTYSAEASIDRYVEVVARAGAESPAADAA